ncbi:uncharacterized protein KIAA0754-like [Dendrobium catenatum]|uniref:uncharacterized protein KIAA0754-like n=1 Tax=Dendrobium catenatum TaxID=906689 RepID=UPI00109F8F66|nr:uncharacterized protein KIAA0754-like [Dendrobium catenatum]
MASFVPSVTFAFGSDARVTLPESLLASLLVGGITFDSFTDSAFVTLVARRIARAPARPVPILAQPVRAVARRPVPRPHHVPVRAAVRRHTPAAPAAQVAQAPQCRQPAAVVPPLRAAVRRHALAAPTAQVAPTPQHRHPTVVVPPVRAAVRRPAPAASIAQAALAPQRRQPAAVVTPVILADVPRIWVFPPASTRKRGAQTEVPSPSSGRVSIFARLSHSETAGQTPALPVVPVPTAIQEVGSDVPSISTSSIERRARRNKNRRLHLATSERTVAPRQRRPRPVTAVPTPEVIVTLEVEAIQGGCFSPLIQSRDEEDVTRITAAPPVTTTLPQARVPRDASVRALSQRIRNIVRLARSRGPLRRQTARRLYSWQRGQTPQQSVQTVPVVRLPAVAPVVGRNPRCRGRRQQQESTRPQADTPVDPVPAVETEQLSEAEQLPEAEQPDEAAYQMEVVVPFGSEAVSMVYNDGSVPTPDRSPVRIKTELAPSTHRITSPMSPYIEAMRQAFLDDDDDTLVDSDEEVPVHRVCVVTRRGHSDEREPEDQDEQGDPEVGGSPRSVDTYAMVLNLQAQMAEMARAMTAMTAQLTALGEMPQVAGVAAASISRDHPVVPPVTLDPLRVDRVKRVVPAAPSVIQSQPSL